MKYFFLILFLAGSLISAAQLRPVKISDHITVSLPEDFRPMTEQEINAKYVYTRRPMALYTDYGASVDFWVNRAKNQWTEGDLDILKDFYKANIASLYDEVDFSRESVEEINGRRFAVFEFSALIKPEEDAITNDKPLRTYNYIQYTIINSNSLVFSFSCPAQHKSKWVEIAPRIMQSVEIKKNFK